MSGVKDGGAAVSAAQSSGLIVKNNCIKDIRLLCKRPWYTWITVWPFALLYVITTTMHLNPELVWDRTTYLVHMTYIDFFHAICIPLVFFMHTFLALFTIWSVKFRALILFHTVGINDIANATHVMVETHVHKGESSIEELIPARMDGLHAMGGAIQPACFVFQQRKWKLDAATKRFVKPMFPTHHEFPYYVQWKGLLNEKMRDIQRDTFGINTMEVTIPEFTDLFVDHALAPFFVFQMFCVLLWCLDEYWYYSLFNGVMMIFMECTVVYQRLRNMKTLRDMAQVPVRDIHVLRDGGEIVVRTTDLLPMDIIIVPSNTPCPVDAVIVQGTCVVNEATLTGESTPQLKEAIDSIDIQLSTKKHARHMLFSGTEIILSNGTHNQGEDGEDGSALAVVLKTGFETKQGKLLRTILHSQGRVSENSSEAFGFIGALVVFALAASGYLLKRGLADPSKSRWKLFLSCTQIITAVVPPELPMELSLAVNQSLLALVNLRVFCTEPFRIPFAGKVDTCCFDKTGTLTTDEMLFGGIDMCGGEGIQNKLKSIPPMSEVVLATCHSLVHLKDVNDTIAGDAMEKASIGALGYKLTSNDTVTYDPPKKATDKEDASTSDKAGKNKHNGNTTASKPSSGEPKKLKIMVRFPFLAALRRMSCVVTSHDGSKLIVAKGSPESIGQLCKNIPEDTYKLAEEHAARGFRVIAMAYRQLTDEEKATAKTITDLKREECEKDLIFAGLAIYECPLKRDAKETIENLRGGSHRCVIITGDSVQTAISVGRDVTLLPCSRQLLATVSGGSIRWMDAVTKEMITEPAYKIMSNTFVQTRKKTIPEKGEWDLCVNAENLTSVELSSIIKQYNEYVSVWARCAPTHKEEIVMDLKQKEHIVLMAGDGTNDVGALKQAHAGIAVLNSASVNAKPEEAKKDEDGKLLPTGPQDHNEPDIPEDIKLPPGFKLIPIAPPIREDAPFMEKMRHNVSIAQRKVQIQQLEKWNKQLKAMKEKRAEENAKLDLPPTPATTSDFMMESLFNSEDEMGGAPMIKLGDASIAAPFTCRSKALMSVCDIVRLGRNTLVTTLQMYKILALNCLVSAYSMSVLQTDGVKMGEKQMITAGIILSVCFMCMTRSQPLPKLCPQRPVTRVFHPSMVCSILLQFALHLYSMIATVQMVAEVDLDTMLEMRRDAENEKFKPTLLNSVMFLMTTLMSGVTFAANYRGEPFMKGIRHNRPMFIALIILCFIIFSFAFELDPEVNEMFEIVTFPSAEFRVRFIKLLATDAIGSFIIEKGCLMLMTDY